MTDWIIQQFFRVELVPDSFDPRKIRIVISLDPIPLEEGGIVSLWGFKYVKIKTHVTNGRFGNVSETEYRDISYGEGVSQGGEMGASMRGIEIKENFEKNYSESATFRFPIVVREPFRKNDLYRCWNIYSPFERRPLLEKYQIWASIEPEENIKIVGENIVFRVWATAYAPILFYKGEPLSVNTPESRMRRNIMKAFSVSMIRDTLHRNKTLDETDPFYEMIHYESREGIIQYESLELPFRYDILPDDGMYPKRGEDCIQNESGANDND